MATNKVTILQAIATSMMSIQHEFKEGDLVQWKREELKDRRIPDMGEPAVVLEVLETPILPRNNNINDDGSHYTWCKLDIVLGMIDKEGDFVHIGVDSRRFEPYKG